ncbi:MAG TPA: Gfo/Idh/MocA family oxidoreductase [Armatimonadota bacterium]|nr:Gfo/Idh/MocA family oxidoreductase [Armatimonadota bacterium]
MANTYRVAFIGTGRPWGHEGRTGFGMAYEHAHGYIASKRCELVAAADIVEANARAFADHFGFATIYTDYKKMLKEIQPDIVSISTWPHLHCEMVVQTAKSKGLKAIHCEKPMAPTWGEAQKMAAACEKAGVQLTFNHQRRFLEPFRMAREMAHDGTIGELVRLEGACADEIDWGTHWLDMFGFYNNETPAKWVMAQIHSVQERKIFGLDTTNQGLIEIMYENGVRGLLFTGWDNDIGAMNRLMGTEGYIDLCDEQPHLRVRGKRSATLKGIKTKQGLHGGVVEAVIDAVAALDEKREPELSAARALKATEVIFAAYESSRSRGRVDLPLKKKDSAYLSMIASGDLKLAKPKPKE